MDEFAKQYLQAGLCVLPARRAEKRPAVGQWKQYRSRLPTEAELSAWLANGPDALCIICGRVSGHAEMIDFDAGGELFSAWAARIPADLLAKLVIERTQRDGRHVFYRCDREVCGNMKLAQRQREGKVITLIETRGEGGLFLCAPTTGYVLLQGDLAKPPLLTDCERDVLLQAAWELNEYVPPVVDYPANSAPVGQRAPSSAAQGNLSADNSHSSHCQPHNAVVGRIVPSSAAQSGCWPDNADRPGDDFNKRGDVREVLAQAGWARVREGTNEYWRRPGKDSGWSATLRDRVFYVFSANAPPFEPNRAYSPFSVYTLLNHVGDFEQAAGSLRLSGFGGDCLPNSAGGVDISAIVQMSADPGACGPHDGAVSHTMALCDAQGAGAPDISHIGNCLPHNGPVGRTSAMCDAQPARAPDIPDPGPMPVEMLRMPGLVGEVMDYCLATAPYPNPVMAFAGALSLLAFLAGRKVRDSGDNRTNIYLLGLAHSSAGKDSPRKVNTRILHEVGLAECLGERFASGEGIQDALFQTPSMLFQTDEIDGMLQSINKAKDARHEAIMSTLLTMYSSANSVFPMRRKAGKEAPGVIDQPHLVVFGTAIPNHYYEALSERMLTNGFFARMIILEAGARGAGQEPSIRELPPRVLATAKWWADYQPGDRRGNLLDVHPVPAIVEGNDEAKSMLVETRQHAEAEYSAAESRSDSVGTTVWGRVSEQTRKLALLYAISENHQSPRISLAAVQWASAFMMHQTRRMLFMAAGHVAENPFHAECLKAVEKLRNAPGHELSHSVLLKRMKMDAKAFAALVETLCQQGDVEVVTAPTLGRNMRAYRLAGGVKVGGETSPGGES